MLSNTDTKSIATPPKDVTVASKKSPVPIAPKETGSVAEKKADDADSGKDAAMDTGKVPSASPAFNLPGEDSASNVFVDADFHVLYKEYNLRRSKTFLTTVEPPSKKLKSEDNDKELPEKRPRSQEDLGEQTAKKLKISEASAEPENREPEKTKTPIEAKQSQAKTSPGKSGRSRKTSLSQSKRSYKKKRVLDASGADGKPNKLCGLCTRIGSVNNLGFLYGPYKPVVTNQDNEEGKEKQEVEETSLWVHEDCAVWAPGVCIVKGKLLGLHEAVADAKQLVGTHLDCHSSFVRTIKFYQNDILVFLQ